MLRYEYIKREWIISPTARRIYRISAAVAVAFFLFWMALVLEVAISGIPDGIRPLVKPFVLLGVLGAGITLVGMGFFLVRFDDSHFLKQAFWFCAMLFPMLGPALYCFIVYSRSEALRKGCGEIG
jgi:hypothetical protein